MNKYNKKMKKKIKRRKQTEETKEKRRNTMYEKKYSFEAINKYIDSIKDVFYSPDYDKTIHIPFKK
jgi:hypothetical protein